ncbi:alpha/beta hydrolase [Janibacter melonis]|uniref:alpha/beta hydrolase n=1 Tax=Janibacter melonis TaxID=262209 RepID=UPI00177A7A37|nr:alpha/beta hydrolase [Janibacter melonis]
MPSATPSAWMPLRTRALAALLRATSGPVDTISPARLARTRRRVPLHRPLTWAIGTPTKGVTTTVREVPVRDGARVRVRVHRPDYVEGALPVVMHFHGGGFAMGHPTAFDPVCTRVAQVAGAVVVSVGYRMAPEHRAPTAVHDCADVTRWVLAHAAELGADPDRLALTGDSAGGNLSAVVAQRLRDLRGPDGEPVLRHQALIYPATDLTMSSPSIDEHADGPVLTRAGITAFRALYLDGTLGVREDHRTDPRHRDPLASPLAGDATGVAPALVQAGELDPLRDDATRYAEHLAEAGVPVRCTTYRRLPHGFASMPGACPGADAAHAELVGEIAHHLHASVGSQRPLAVGDAEDQEHAQ